MPVYNGGDYLRPSIASILRQTYRDFEFLIINDCSTDHSLETIYSFQDPRITVHNNEINLGQTKSLNVGLKLAKGKYIARMDADDMAFPIWLEKLVNYINQHPHYAAVGSAAVVIDERGRKKQIRMPPANFHKIIFRIFFAPPINHVSVLLNKDIILKNGGYDEEFKITQDYELWSSLIRNGYSLTNLSDILVAYRVHSHSIGFIEANKRGFEEKSKTVFRNVNALTHFKITYAEAMDICKLFYHTPELNPEDFERAQHNFEHIYPNLIESLKLPSDLIKSGISSQMLKPYCKLAVLEIQNNGITKARAITLSYCRRYGFHIMPLLIFLTTLAGYRASKKLPQIYEKWLQLTTEITLKLKLTLG